MAVQEHLKREAAGSINQPLSFPVDGGLTLPVAEKTFSAIKEQYLLELLLTDIDAGRLEWKRSESIERAGTYRDFTGSDEERRRFQGVIQGDQDKAISVTLEIQFKASKLHPTDKPRMIRTYCLRIESGDSLESINIACGEFGYLGPVDQAKFNSFGKDWINGNLWSTIADQIERIYLSTGSTNLAGYK